MESFQQAPTKFWRKNNVRCDHVYSNLNSDCDLLARLLLFLPLFVCLSVYMFVWTNVIRKSCLSESTKIDWLYHCCRSVNNYFQIILLRCVRYYKVLSRICPKFFAELSRFTVYLFVSALFFCRVFISVCLANVLSFSLHHIFSVLFRSFVVEFLVQRSNVFTVTSV